MVGHRNNVVMPFAHPKYAPQRVDYFSSYILMALTDVVAILIIVLIMWMEKTGRIKRRGKLEDQAANA